MDKKTIVFDLDDTLVNEIDYLKSAFKEIARFLDPENKNLFNEMFSWYTRKENVFQNLLDRYQNVNIQEIKNWYRNHVPDFNFESEKRQFLLNLKKEGHILGLVTDGFSITQRNKIKALELENMFDLIIISEEFGYEKPNHNNFSVFHQFQTNEYYYIADNVSKDFLAPNQLGWKTVCLLDNGNNIHGQDFSKEPIYLPKTIIKNLCDFNF
jgi:putative hydrolase of the HAD superfamily